MGTSILGSHHMCMFLLGLAMILKHHMGKEFRMLTLTDHLKVFLKFGVHQTILASPFVKHYQSFT